MDIENYSKIMFTIFKKIKARATSIKNGKNKTKKDNRVATTASF